MPDSTVQEITRRAKTALRQRMTQLRVALSDSAHARRCEGIVTTLRELPEIQNASSVGLFWPISTKREVDLRPLDTMLRNQGKSLYYPFMDPRAEGGFQTGFRKVDRIDELASRGRGFSEPDPTRPAALRGEIQVVVVPALAVDPRGHRLGYGGGIYDATLPDFCPPANSVVVAFDFQLLVELPTLPHDVPVKVVVTDSRLLHAEATTRDQLV